jgi:hypothetical protein
VLSEYFENTKDKTERNTAIIHVIEDGYTQAEVAKYIALSRSAVSKIVKSIYSTPDSFGVTPYHNIHHYNKEYIRL